ncbi:PAS domain-containing protein [bacterium]|nr:PAS domain-containing protein [bacterium]
MNASSPSHRNPADSPALRIAILYVVIGVIWILLSDRVADLLAPAPATVSRLQTTKGWFFVVGSGIFFYVLIEHYWKTAAHSRSAAERAERRLSALVRSLPGMVYRRRMGTDPAMEYVSEACRAITGRAPEDFVEGGLNWNDLVVEEDRPDVERIQRHALERRVPFVVNYRLQAAGGGEKWVSEHGVGVYGSSGLEAVEGHVPHHRHKQLRTADVPGGEDERRGAHGGGRRA